jgi:Tektin family
MLDRTLESMEREISNLCEVKCDIESVLDQRVGMANHINVENLVGREGRIGIDIVQDLVEDQLTKVSFFIKLIPLIVFLYRRAL